MTAFFTELFNQRGDPGVNSHELQPMSPGSLPAFFLHVYHTQTHTILHNGMMPHMVFLPLTPLPGLQVTFSHDLYTPADGQVSVTVF